MNPAEKAWMETTSGVTTAHHGGGAGRPFWNVEAKQFMYVPSFQFPPIPGCEKYIYEATDETGRTHTFAADSACALLTPIWGDIPEGVVTLQVFSTDEEGQKRHLVGARTFFRMAPFSDDYPEAACGYGECARGAFSYCFNSRIIRHWLEQGTPDPWYDLNVYPSKMVAAVMTAMLRYGELDPAKNDDCVKIACRAADYLLSITEPAGSPLEGLPPTYYTDFRQKDDTMNDLTAGERKDTIMMFYPAAAGSAYLALEKKTNKPEYLNAALKIGAYYRDHVLPNGSWYLVVSRLTGEPVARNYCMPTNAILPFIRDLYKRTGDKCWQILADNALAYVENNALKTYNWEGQFEDSVLSANYSNLAHGDCNKLIAYYAENYADDPEKMETARELMRFVEDQFVVWNRPCPWDRCNFDVTCWPTPCGLEQYNWAVPVDASTSLIAQTFLILGKATGDSLYFAKAKALMNTVTRMQNKKDGRIPTEWKEPGFMDNDNAEKEFWINCMLFTATVLTDFADYFGE